MKIHEIVTESIDLEERKKKRRKKSKYAAWGPGPYGWYGYDAGYSGAGGVSAGGDAGGGVGEDHVDEHKKGVRARIYNKKPKSYIEPPKIPKTSVAEDKHPNEKPSGPEVKPTMPKGTVKVDVSDVYDWYKLGQHISDLKGLGKHDFGKGPPSAIMSFGSEEEEHEYIKDLEKTGLTTTDIDPVDPKQPKGMKRQKTDPTYNVGENFADGKNPQDKGDSARHGISKGMSIAQLKKIRSSDTASPRKKQLAHWQINMRQGKKK
jgi:hypothetical protein